MSPASASNWAGPLPTLTCCHGQARGGNCCSCCQLLFINQGGPLPPRYSSTTCPLAAAALHQWEASPEPAQEQADLPPYSELGGAHALFCSAIGCPALLRCFPCCIAVTFYCCACPLFVLQA